VKLRLVAPLVLATLLAAFAVGAGSAQAAPAAVPAASTAATPSATGDRLQIGVQFKGMWSDYTDTQRRAVLDKLAAAGADSVRIDVSWAMLQPDSRDSFSAWGVGFVDKVVNMAVARGLTPLITLWMCPDWANGGRGDRALPTDPADFGRIAQWAGARYKGKVGGWEVWNEPNDNDFMRGADPAAYVRLLKAAYKGFKAGAPATPVLFGGTSYVDTNWVARAYAAGAKGSFDAMATHPYQGMADARPELPDDGTREVLDHVRVLRSLMVKYGDGAKKIWFTETGWSSHANAVDQPSWSRGVSTTTQAQYLTRMLKHVQASYPYVSHVYWYTERNQATGDPHQDNFGLMKRDLTPKPAYYALRDYVTARDGTAPTAQVSTSTDVQRPAGRLRAATVRVRSLLGRGGAPV